MPNITEEKWIEMLEKKADGSYIAKYPKVKSKSGVTFDEHLAEKATQNEYGHIRLQDIPNPEIATQIEAEAGTNNTKMMTPLRVKEAIDALVTAVNVVQGSYIGNNQSDRIISLGFTPKLVLITNFNNRELWIMNYGTNDYSALMLRQDNFARSSTIGIVNNGFKVNNTSANSSTKTFYYVAIG